MYMVLNYWTQDDPGFQFCLENPQVLSSLQSKSLFELSVTDKLKLLTVMMQQMLTFAGVRDEIETRMESMLDAGKELREAQAEENKRLARNHAENVKRRKEERLKMQEKNLKEAENKKNEKEKKLIKDEKGGGGEAGTALSTRQQEKVMAAREKEEEAKLTEEDRKRAEWFETEERLTCAIAEYQVLCNG